MKLTRGFFVLVMLLGLVPALVAAPAGETGLTVKTFQFKYKQADQAAAAIKSLISGQGSVSIQPASNTLVVTDRAENIRSIAQAISSFDQPARALQLQLKLVAASREANPGPVPADLQELSAKLSGVLRFNSFEKVGEITASGKEGEPVMANVDGYRADFKFGEFDALSGMVHINDFQLSRIQGDKGSGQLVSLLKTSLNLKAGQTVILGASRLPDSQRALMLVLVAKAP